MSPLPFPAPLPWQQVPWHERRSYWELDEGQRRGLRGALEAEGADLARHAEAALDDYAARPGTLGGQLVNGDMLATLLPTLRHNPTQGYEALEDPAGRAAVHLNALAKRLRDRALALARGAPVIIFMGGQATGRPPTPWPWDPPSAPCSTRPTPIPTGWPSSWSASGERAAARSTSPTRTAIPRAPSRPCWPAPSARAATCPWTAWPAPTPGPPSRSWASRPGSAAACGCTTCAWTTRART